MTDVSPGNGGPGNDPESNLPPGPRRSTYTPPDPGAPPPAFDDDALAEAMAAEVAAYTSPIAIVPPRAAPSAPVEQFPAEPAPVAAAPGAASVAEPAPVDEARVEVEPAEAEMVEAAPVDSATADEVAVEVPTFEESASPTLEAIQRLEDELRRRAEASTPFDVSAPPTMEAPLEEPAPFVDVTPEAVTPEPVTPSPGTPVATERPFPDSPLFPAPPTFLRPAPPDEAAPEAATEPPVGPQPPAASPAVDPDPPLASFAPPTTAAVPIDPPVWDGPAPWTPEPWSPPGSPPEPSSPEPPTPAAETPEPTAPEPPTPEAAKAEPAIIAPPPLVEPPAAFTSPSTGSIPTFAPPPATPAFGMAPVTPPVDLPPPGQGSSADLAHLPPPIGLEAAALPPYDPALDAVPGPGPLAPPPGDFDALLGVAPAPHPDDVHSADQAATARVDSEDDDAVDEVDRAFTTGALVVDSTGSVAVVHPPSEPIPTARLADDEAALVDDRVESHPALVVESAGSEPTALDLRAGRAARLFWLWFAVNSSVISLSLGAVLFGLGMSLRQTLIAIVVGVAISFLPLGLVTLAGKWSGQPTMVVSRATFGVTGNAVPTILAIVSRVFWGGALLWLLASGVAQVLVDSGLDAGLGSSVWTFVGLGVGFALAFVVAIFGYGLIARVQLVLSILTALLVVGVIVITSSHVDLEAAQLTNDGPWILVVTGVVLVFSFVGLAWVHSSADVARYQRTSADGGSTMLWATFGATLPAFLLIAWGALLAASDPLIADGLATNPLHTIAALLPIWYPAPLIAALALGLLSGVVLTMYSGGFALQSLGVRARRSATTVIAGVLVLAIALALLFLAVDVRGLVRDVATTIAVPVAAWAGIFGAEVMIRRRGFDSPSLLRRGGIYPAVRWINLIGLLVVSAVGFGLTSAALPGLDWQGYLFPLLGLGGDDPLLSSDVGVLVALVLGLLLPLITAVPTVRRQERALGDDPEAPRPVAP